MRCQSSLSTVVFSFENLGIVKLKARFGDEEDIVQSLLINLLNDPKLKLSDNISLVKFSEELVSVIEILEYLSSN